MQFDTTRGEQDTSWGLNRPGLGPPGEKRIMMKTLKFLIMIFPEASVPVCSQRDSSWICHCLCEDRSRMRREGRKEISKTIFTQLQESVG